jgi:plastocyanin
MSTASKQSLRALALLAALLLGAPALAGTQVIEIRKFAFVASEVTVATGTTVTWVNRDETPHTVIGEAHAFASQGLDTGDQFAFTFEREGDYHYVCSLHPFMTGTVHVRRP